MPEHAERARHSQRGVAVAVGAAEERQGGADVGLLVAQQSQRLPLLVPPQRHLGVLDDAAEVGGVATRHLDRPPGRLEPFGGVLTQRLQHPVPARGAGLDDDHGLLDEPTDGVEDLAGACVLVPDDLLGRHQRPPALEDREPVEHPLLGLRQQLVAPVDGGAQRLLPCLGGAGAGGEQGEPVREPLGHLDRRQRRHPGGGELEGERDAVEGPGDGTDRGRGCRHRTAARGERRGPVRRTAAPPGSRAPRPAAVSSGGVSSGPTVTCTSSGTASASRLVASTVTPGHRPRMSSTRRGGGVDDVLAVVDQQQHPAPGQERDEPVAQVAGRDGAVHRHAEGVGDRDRHLVGGADRRQPHPERAVRVVRPPCGRRWRAPGTSCRRRRGR